MFAIPSKSAAARVFIVRTVASKPTRRLTQRFWRNANVVTISDRLLNTEQVSFTYQKIIWTWAEGGITAEDEISFLREPAYLVLLRLLLPLVQQTAAAKQYRPHKSRPLPD